MWLMMKTTLQQIVDILPFSRSAVKGRNRILETGKRLGIRYREQKQRFSFEKGQNGRQSDESRFNEVVLEHLPGLFVVFDSECRIVRCNGSILRELGYSVSEFGGRSIVDFVVADDREKLLEGVDHLMVSGSGSIRLRLESRTGGERVFDFRGRKFVERGKRYVAASGVDITSRLRMEREKVYNSELLTQLFEHSPNGIVLVDRQNRIQRSNEAFRELFGYEEEELSGRNVDELIVPEKWREKSAQFMNEKVLSGSFIQLETVRYDRHGKSVPVLLGTVPVFSHGEVSAAYGIFVDLTQRVRLEGKISELLKAEKRVRQQLEVLLQEVHHRVKNNLAVITALMDLQLMEEGDVDLATRLKEVRSRIFSIARIHESIYQQEDLLRVDFDLYLKNMTGVWKELNGLERIHLDLQTVDLNVNQAVSCGLLANELFNLIHASCREKEGPVSVGLFMIEDQVVLEIESPSADFVSLREADRSEVFARKIIQILLKQLDARLNVDGRNPQKLSFQFRKAEVKGSSSSFI